MKWIVKPGDTPPDDISGLKLRISNPTQAQIEQFEGMNIARAQEKYFARRLTKRMAPFNLRWLKKLHQEMLGDVWEWAGEFRVTNKSIGVDKLQIQEQLLQLLADLSAWPGMEMPILEQAVRLHHRAVWIHPFENGNGRWARMVSDLWLRKNGANAISWPVTIEKTSPIRDEYIAALKEADAMNEKPLVDLHRRYWQEI